jgi:hypothetical protein
MGKMKTKKSLTAGVFPLVVCLWFKLWALELSEKKLRTNGPTDFKIGY